MDTADVGSSANGLTTDLFSDFGADQCGGPIQKWIDTEWPIDTIAAGDMVFTKGELIDYFETHDDFRATLVGEMAAVQLDMAVGRIVPDSVLDNLLEADEWLMTDDTGIPPLVVVGTFEDLNDFNSAVGLDCLNFDAANAEVTPQTIDVRDDLVEDVPGLTHRSDVFAIE
jgi:hypothetical protein